MIPHVIKAKYIKDYRLWLLFNNGQAGEINLEAELWGTMFKPLKDQSLFARVTVDQELGTIVWPNGADLAPEYLLKNIQKITS